MSVRQVTHEFPLAPLQVAGVYTVPKTPVVCKLLQNIFYDQADSLFVLIFEEHETL